MPTKAQLQDHIKELQTFVRHLKEEIAARDSLIATLEAVVNNQKRVIEVANEMTDGAFADCIEKHVYH